MNSAALAIPTFDAPPRPLAADSRPAVLQVVHSLNPGGTEMLVRDMVRQLHGRFRFIIACLDEPGAMAGSLGELGVEVHCLRRRPGIDLKCARRIAALADASRAAIIHAQQYTPFVYSALARWFTRTPVKLIYSEHGRPWPDHASLKRRLANRLLYRLADRITAVGGFVRSAMDRTEKIPARSIQVIPNGINTDAFTSIDPDARHRIRRELGIDARTPVILQVGSFRPIKDHATALRTLRLLHDLRQPATLLLAGAGPALDETRALAATLGMMDHVRFLGIRADIGPLWAAADVALSTSLSEGISLALLEAMAAGRPIVATDVGGNSEIIQHNITGFLAPRQAPQALALCVMRLLADPALAAQMGQAGRLRVQTHFCRERMHQSFAGIYEELIHG